MKLKKFFAGVLAAAMMLTVGATAAFADEPISVPDNSENSYKGAKVIVADTEGHAYLNLTKVLEVKEGTAPDYMKFNFNVYEGTATTGTALDTESVEFNAGNYTSKGGEDNKGVYTGTFKLDVAKLTEGKSVGKYTFTIVESMDKAYQSVTAERETLTMVVSKVNAKELKEDSTAEFGYFVALKTASGKVLATEAFKNYYGNNNSVNNLTLSKTVHGALGDLSKPFTFKITFNKNHEIADATGLYKGPQLPANLDGITVTGKNAGDYLTIGEEYTVTMKHGQSLTFTNLPADVEYVVKEDGSEAGAAGVTLTDTNDAGNTVKYDVTVKNANGENVGFDSNAVTVSGSISADVTTAFHNTNAAEPDMGVVLDNAPYIAMLAIVAIGGVALMLNKRRRDEE